MRLRPPPGNATPACASWAVQLIRLRCRHTPAAPRSVSSAASNRIESPDGLGTPDAARSTSSRLALRRRSLSYARILPKRPSASTFGESTGCHRRNAAPYGRCRTLCIVVEHMKAIVALLGPGLTNQPRALCPRQSPSPHPSPQTDSPSPLSALLNPREVQLRLTPPHREVALNDNPNRYPESRSTPASTGSLPGHEHLIERPGYRPHAERNLSQFEPRRASLGLDQHLLNRPRMRLSPLGIGIRHQVLNRADGVMGASTRNATTARRSCASSTRTSTAAPWSSGVSKWLRSTDSAAAPTAYTVGREISYVSLSAVFEPWACCPATAAAAH